MIKNICIMSSVIFCMALTSCKFNFTADAIEQKYSGSIIIYPVEDYKK